MQDHYDHIHVGWRAVGGDGELTRQFASLLEPDQWRELIGRISEIENPRVPRSPSKYALPDNASKHGSRKRAGNVHPSE